MNAEQPKRGLWARFLSWLFTTAKRGPCDKCGQALDVWSWGNTCEDCVVAGMVECSRQQREIERRKLKETIRPLVQELLAEAKKTETNPQLKSETN